MNATIFFSTKFTNSAGAPFCRHFKYTSRVKTVVEIVASLWARLAIRVCATNGVAPPALAANGTILQFIVAITRAVTTRRTFLARIFGGLAGLSVVPSCNATSTGRHECRGGRGPRPFRAFFTACGDTAPI